MRPRNIKSEDIKVTYNVLAWNIHGLGDKLGYPDIYHKLKRHDIIFLSETWLKENTPEKEYQLDGFVPKSVPRCNIDNNNKVSGGLLLYIKKDIRTQVDFINSHCDHFLVIRVNNLPRPIYVIFSYVLPYDSSYKCQSCDNNFYEQLYDLYIKYSDEGIVYICGDLNSRTSNMNDCPESYDTGILSEAGIDDCLDTTFKCDSLLPDRISFDSVCNKQGKLLLDFCKSTGTRIVNGRYGKDSGNFTFYRLFKKGTNKVAKSTIDYLLVPSKYFSDIIDFRVDEKLPESDHCSISFAFDSNVISCENKNDDCEMGNSKTYCKFKWDPSKQETFINCLFDEVGLEYLEKFTDSIRELQSCDIVSDMFECFVEQAASRSLSKVKCNKTKSNQPHNEWYDAECKMLRRNLRGAKNDKAALLGLQSEYNRIVQKKKRNVKLKRANDLMYSKNSTDMWQKLKQFGSKSQTDTQLGLKDFYEHFSQPAVDNPDNMHNFDVKFENDIVNLMKMYRVKAKACENVNDSSDTTLITELLNSIITEEEVIFALTSLKKGKSPGLDGLPIDIFISCKNALLPCILELLNYVLDKGVYPEKWAQGLIDPQYKKGCTELASNYRRISILPAISKIIEFILNNRLQFVDKIFLKEDPYNGGFKKDSRTTDNIFVLSSLIECSQIQKKPLYVCFVDFKRAFDCLKRDFMFFKLLSNGYNSKVLSLIMNMYGKTKSFVKWNGKLSPGFLDELGVAQGGILSPYLFNSFLKDLGHNLDKQLGVVIDSETILTHLFWADDLILMSESADDLQAQIDNLYRFCSKWQLIINNLKTNVLVFNVKQCNVNQQFHVGTVPIEVATKYTYLGMLFSTKEQSKMTKYYILNNCRRALFKIRNYCLPLGQVPPKLGLQLFNSLIMPLMDYASELWSNKTVNDGLEVFHLGYLKRILGVRPNTPTLAVYGELGTIPLSYRLEMNKLKYLHRLCNLPSHSIVKKVFAKVQFLHECGFSTWVTKCMRLYNDFESVYDINFEQFTSLSKNVVKSKLKQYELQRFAEKWNNDIDAITKDKKLRTYVLFKNQFKMESYLSLNVPKYRYAISRFRCSSHNLPVELGRHTRPKKTPLEERLCKTCNLLGDEVHHLTECKANEKHRIKLFEKVTEYKPTFDRLTDIEKFKFVMQCKEVKIMQALGMFLYNSQSDM